MPYPLHGHLEILPIHLLLGFSLILDCAPTVFSPTVSSSDAEEELLLAAMEITRCLYGQHLRDGNLVSEALG